MLKRTLHYLWGKKFLFIILILVIFLLPNIIARDLQVRTVPIITTMTIENSGDTIKITAKKLKASPGESTIQSESVTYTGQNIQTMLKDVSLAHCTNIQFNGDPDLKILNDLYNYRDLRANTKVNGQQTIDEILRESA